jgi:hypothetical protein
MSEDIDLKGICEICNVKAIKENDKLCSELNIMEAGIYELANLLDRGVCELEQDEDGWFIHDIYNDIYITSPDLRGLIMKIGEER